VLLSEPQQNKLTFEDIIFLGGVFIRKWKKRIKKNFPITKI
jgi:hypothetical protein